MASSAAQRTLLFVGSHYCIAINSLRGAGARALCAVCAPAAAAAFADTTTGYLLRIYPAGGTPKDPRLSRTRLLFLHHETALVRMYAPCASVGNAEYYCCRLLNDPCVKKTTPPADRFL